MRRWRTWIASDGSTRGYNTEANWPGGKMSGSTTARNAAKPATPPNPAAGVSRRWTLWARAGLAGAAIFIAGVLIERIATEDGGHFLAYLGVTSFGALVGATELVARYRDRP